MKIYSIKEIVEATNNIFDSKNDKPKKIRSFNDKPKLKPRKIEKPLILTTELISKNSFKQNTINHKNSTF